MSSLFTRLAALLGVGGAATYAVESNDSLRVGLVEMGQQALARLTRAGDSPTASSSGHNLEVLERQLARLSDDVRTLSSDRNSVTVVSTSQRTTGLLVPAAVGVGVLYLKYVKGYKFESIFYVTQLSFKKGLEQMGDMMGEVREQLNASMESLGWKVDAGLRHQRLMGEDVRRARDHVQHLEALVLSMEGRLHDSINSNTDKLDYCTAGIGLLCHVVNEHLLEANGLRSDRLQSFITQLPPTSDNLQLLAPGGDSGGLRALVTEGTGVEAAVRGRTNLGLDAALFGSVRESSSPSPARPASPPATAP